MGASFGDVNRKINNAVNARAATRSSPSAVQGANISQVTEPPMLTAAPYQGISSQEYSSGEKYDTSSEALDNYASFLEGIQENIKETKSKFNYQSYDPGDFARAGYSGPSGLTGQASSDAVSEYLLKNKIPPFIEKDGQKLYFTTGLSEDSLAKTLGDDYIASGSYKPLGPAGTYSTVYVPPESVLSGLNPVLRAGLGALTSGLSEGFFTGVKALSGETLTASDYLNLAVPTLQKLDVLVPPAQGATGAAALGKGFGNLGYADSVALLNVAATGDPTSFIISKYGNEALDKAFENIPTDSDLLGMFQSDDVKAGMIKAVDKLARGEDFDAALVAGLGKYITEGGGLNIEGLDVDLGVVEDVLRDAVRPIGEIGTELANQLESVGRTIDKEILQPVTQPIGDVLSAADTAVRGALPDISIPDISIPNFNPNLGSFDLRLLSGTALPSPTRTTDSLFGDETFKFKTQIEDTQERLEFGDEQPNYIIDLNESPFEGEYSSDSLELELFEPKSELEQFYETRQGNIF